MLKMSLVGAGPWAGMFHAPMLADCPEIQFESVFARRLEAAQQLADRFHTKAVGSFEALLKTCDAVAFAVPPNIQAELAPRAAAAGKHLLLEKPLAFTVSDARAIVDAAEAAGVVTQLNVTNRYCHPVRDFLAAVSASGVHAVFAEFISGSSLTGSPFATAWRQGADSPITDLGAHGFDLIEAAAGPIVALSAVEAGGVVAVTTRHTSGAIGSLTLSCTTPGARGPLRCTALGPAGRLDMGDPNGQPKAEVMVTQADEFLAAISGERSQPLDARRGLLLQELMAAAEEALAQGSLVDLP